MLHRNRTPGSRQPQRAVAKKSLAIVSAATAALAVLVPTNYSTAMPIEEAVYIALRTHPSILATQQLGRATGNAVDIARAGFFPTLDFSLKNGWARTNNTGTRARATRGPSDTQSIALFKTEASLTLVQMLFDGFATSQRTKAAKVRLGGAEFSVIGASEAVALRAASGYVNVLRSQILLAQADRYVAAHQGVVTALETQVEAGAGTQADLDQAVGRMAVAEAARTQFQGALMDAEAAFKEVIGDWPSNLSEPLVVASDLPMDVETVVADALQSHPSLRSAAQNITALEHDLRAAGAPFFPKLTLDITGTRNENAGGVEAPSSDTTLMFSIAYNLYKGGADKAALETAKALLMESRLRLDETQRLIEQGSRVAFNAYQIASDRMPQLSDALAAADEAAEAFPGQFELGERTLLDRLAVEDQMFAAESGILNGRNAVVLSHYQVLAAMGRLRDAF